MPSFLINTSASANGLFAPNTNNASLGASYNALAADADGDGIADSFLVRMPIGNINGITYYHAVRIVDNAAAINLNTAWADRPLDPATNNPISFGAQFFPTSINLVDLIPGN